MTKFRQLKGCEKNIDSSQSNMDSIRAIPGSSAIMMAAKNGHLEIVQLLIEHGANIHQTNTLGHNALFLAQCMGHDNVASILMLNGAIECGKDELGHTANDYKGNPVLRNTVFTTFET